MQTDAAIAQSTPVAAAVVAQLGIQQTPASFLGTYTVAAGTTTTILTITAKGPSDDAAVQRASAIATQFLAFRAKYLQEQLNQTIDSLNQQVSQAQQHLDSIDKQISQVSAQPTSPGQQAQLGGLQNQQTDAANALNSVKQSASYSQLQAQTTTAQMVHGSEVLSSATPGKRSVKKALALYGVGGLVGGLVVGMVIVVIGGHHHGPAPPPGRHRDRCRRAGKAERWSVARPSVGAGPARKVRTPESRHGPRRRAPAQCRAHRFQRRRWPRRGRS